MTERANYVRIRLELDAVASSMSAARKCWLLVNVSQSQVIADLMHVISRRFQVTSNCSLYLDDYWLPPGESTMILKDNDVIKVVSSERVDNLDYRAVTTVNKKLKVTSTSNSSSSSSSRSSDDDSQLSRKVSKTLESSNIQPSLKSNAKILQSGAMHTVFSDSDTELVNNINTSTTAINPISNIVPELNSKNNAEDKVGSQNARKNRRRRNRKKARNFKQTQQPVGGEDDVLVAVSKIFKNATDSEGCLEANKTSDNEASLCNNDANPNTQENELNVNTENTGDDFGMDFAADFDAYQELSGTPRVGDVLAYKELEMSATYTPKISTYKVCKVIDLISDSHSVKVQLSWTTYKAECAKAADSHKRKFEFDISASEEATTSVEKKLELELELNRLHIIRLVPVT